METGTVARSLFSQIPLHGVRFPLLSIVSFMIPWKMEFNGWTSTGLWHHHNTVISAYSEKSIQVGYFFDTVAATSNTFLGWMIDDVEVWGCNVFGTSPIVAPAYANPTPVCETASYLLDGTGSYA